MSMTGLLQWGIRHSVEATNQLVSVERILEYVALQPEKQPKKAIDIDETWPSKGKIEFRNVTYRYCYEAEAVLRCLTFSIEPKEKIGIVGRTGAGKINVIISLYD